MTRKAKYILILMLAIIVADASAQNSQVLYFMNLPQNHLLNPALRPSNKVYIGLPVLSGINLNVNDNFVNFSDVFMKGQPSDSIISILHPGYNINDFLAKISNKNSIETEATIQLFGLGFSVGKDGYVFLDINERIDGNVVIPGDIFRLALEGNEPFVGSKIDLSSLSGDLKYYREVGLGYSKNVTDKLRIGVKGKLLFGIACASIDNKSLGITVNNDYSHTLDADLNVNISGPITINKNSNNGIDSISSVTVDNSKLKTAGFFLGQKNMGLGLDVGATYNITDKFVVSAAITDLGFIRWARDVTNIQAKSQFEFSGLNMLDVINGTKTLKQLGTDMQDSLKKSFVVSDSKAPFTTYLPFGVTLGGCYELSRRFSLGLLSYSKVIGTQIRESLTLSANVNLGNALSTSISYSAANTQYDNLGAGLAFRAGIVQFYLISDRIPVMWNIIKVNNTNVPLPSNWNTINLRLGMNLVFGNNIRKKNDKPMLLVQ